MYLYVVLLLAPWMVCGQPVSFTINSIRLEPSPSSPVRNGDNLSLRCLVDIAKSDDFEVNRKFTFYKDDKQIHSVNTTKDYVFYTIHRASVSRSGLYKCQVNMDGKQKTSTEVKVKVTGLLAPLISISKTEVSEGDEITVRCETNEEPPMIFKFFKEKEDPKSKQATNTNYTETTYVIKEGEVILNFECSVKMVIEDEPESPPSIKTKVAVVEPFTTPIITVSPSNNFTEGAYMTVTCTVQKSDRNSEKVTITLQKGNHILNASSNGRLTYSQVADVSDTGNYICKAEGKTASKTNSTMIKVKELFPRPRFTLKPTKNQTEYINDGDTVIMQCSVPGLSPQAASQQDFGVIDNKGEQLAMKRGELKKQLRETDSGSYSCKVTISNITKISEPVQVKVYAPVTKPELKQIVKDNKMVVLGDTLSLTCKSPSGTPPILYTLLREGEQIGRKEVYNRSEAVFMVNTTKQHDLGQYQCRASNRNLQSGVVSDALNVTVITPVREVSLVIIPKNGEVEEGAELSLVCKVENGTLPITFYFYAKKVVDVLLHNVTKTDKTHAEFILSPFTKQNDGPYYCTASNKANKKSSSESLEVKAVLARWKAAVIVIFIIAIVVAAIGIALYLYLDKKRKGKTISSKSARSTKAANSSSEKSAADVKTDDSYFGSVQNEEELHILKTTEENIGNNQQNHDVEHTEADGLAPDPHHDSAENNVNENPNVNNLT